MIFVCGVPRSGTTWIAKILSQPKNVSYFHEPDNEHNNLLAYIYKQRLPRFPYLTSNLSKNGLFSIYKNILTGKYLFGFSRSSILIKKVLNLNLSKIEKEIKRKNSAITSTKTPSFKPSPISRLKRFITTQCCRLMLTVKRTTPPTKRVLVKSVHSILALSYLQAYFDLRPVIILRHPANIVSSHLKLDNPDIWRNIFNQTALMNDYFLPFKNEILKLDGPLEKAGAQVAAFYYVINQQLKNNPDWIVVKHENFCSNPVGKFNNLFKKLNLKWSQEIRNKISELNKSGQGYSYKRKAKQQINKWKKRLNASQIHQIKKGYSILLPDFYQEFYK